MWHERNLCFFGREKIRFITDVIRLHVLYLQHFKNRASHLVTMAVIRQCSLSTILYALLLLFQFAVSFRLLSWNLLAPTFTRPSKYPDTLPEHLDWTYRLPLILQRIHESNADIVCLQEVQIDCWDEICLRLDGEFDLRILQNVTKEHPVALAILVKTSFLGVECVAAESRSRAILTVLKFAHTNETLFLANVHLQAGKNETKERFLQVQSLLKRIRKHASDMMTQTPNIIIIGDFNMVSTDPLYNLLVTGKLSSELASASSTVVLPYLPLTDARNNTFTDYDDDRRLQVTFRSGCTLDYLFTNRPMAKVKAWKPVLLKSSHQRQRSSYYSWPNHDNPSDHLPIGANVSL
jgi:mRNA deadenylase 3'-5' endonuclease subunit Ccr4